MLIDFITDLLPSKALTGDTVYNSVLVVVDRYTKMCVYIPTTKRCDAATLANLFVDAVICKYSVP